MGGWCQTPPPPKKGDAELLSKTLGLAGMHPIHCRSALPSPHPTFAFDKMRIKGESRC